MRTLEGVEVQFSGTGRVEWMSDWSRADELVGLGLLERRHYGPSTYGHVEYFEPEEHRPDRARKACWCGRTDGAIHQRGYLGHDG